MIYLNLNDVVERQIDHMGNIEDSYRVFSDSGRYLYGKAASFNSLAVSFDINDIEMISYSVSDGISTQDESIVFVFGSKPFSESMYLNYWAIKFTSDGQVLRKYYTGDFWRMPNYQLPFGARLASKFGLGFYEDKEIYDVYFFHDDPNLVFDHVGLYLPLPEEKYCLYGVTYGSDLKALKLKRYYYPSDPNILVPEIL